MKIEQRSELVLGVLAGLVLWFVLPLRPSGWILSSAMAALAAAVLVHRGAALYPRPASRVPMRRWDTFLRTLLVLSLLHVFDVAMLSGVPPAVPPRVP